MPERIRDVDNIIPCPYCAGTGKVSGKWFIQQHHKDFLDGLLGPFRNHAEAEAEAQRIDTETGNTRSTPVFLLDTKERSKFRPSFNELNWLAQQLQDNGRNPGSTEPGP